MEFIKPKNIIKCNSTLNFNSLDDDMLKALVINKCVKGNYDEYFPDILISDIYNIILSYLWFVEDNEIHLSIPLEQIVDGNNCLKKHKNLSFCGYEDESEMMVKFNEIKVPISGYYPLHLHSVFLIDIEPIDIKDYNKFVIVKISNKYCYNDEEEFNKQKYVYWKKDLVKEFESLNMAKDYLKNIGKNDEILIIDHGMMGIDNINTKLQKNHHYNF